MVGDCSFPLWPSWPGWPGGGWRRPAQIQSVTCTTTTTTPTTTTTNHNNNTKHTYIYVYNITTANPHHHHHHNQHHQPPPAQFAPPAPSLASHAPPGGEHFGSGLGAVFGPKTAHQPLTKCSPQGGALGERLVSGFWAKNRSQTALKVLAPRGGMGGKRRWWWRWCWWWTWRCWWWCWR